MSQAAPGSATPADDLPDRRFAEIVDHARPELRGLRIGFREAGDAKAPPLVCLHGIGSNASGYRHQLSGLSDRFRVVAWDAPGYGRSDNLPWDKPRDVDYADALLGFLDTLGLPSICLAGSSFGAIVAASFAASYPARVTSLILSAPAPGFARLPQAEREALLRQRIEDMERLGPAELAKQRAPRLVAPTAPPAVIEAATALVAATRPHGYAQAARVLDNADTAASAERVAAPTLVLVGTEDRITPAETCAKPVYAALKNGRIEILEGVGHLIKLEAPALFNRLVAEFVESSTGS